MGRARARARQGREAKVRPPKGRPTNQVVAKHEGGLRPEWVFGGVMAGALWGVLMWLFVIVTGGTAALGLLVFFVIAAALVGGIAVALVEAANARKRGVPVFPRSKGGESS